MKNKKILIMGLLIVIVSAGVLFNSFKKGRPQQDEIRDTNNEIRYYTCGMHPSVKVLPDEYNKGNVNCPICNMKLTPVYKEKDQAQAPSSELRTPNSELQTPNYYGCGMEGEEHVFLIDDGLIEDCPVCGMALMRLSREEADKLKGVVSRVRIKGEQAALAGVRTEPARKLHLYKEIRTVGKVAYDPGLAVAQEEFISGLKALEKIREGGIFEIEERALDLVESSKRKLKLLGLSEEQITELEGSKEVHTSLILPEEKMWIYGAVYEYELGWVKIGGKVKVRASSLPGEEFTGTISSVNPVLDPKTRSVTFRAEVGNPGLKLKPEMYVDVIIQSMYGGPGGEHLVLAIPKNAVLDTGTRKIVWIEKENGEYEGRAVETGPEATVATEEGGAKYYPVLKGLEEGQRVVVKANFLIDSQSQISGVAAGAYGGALGTEEKKGSVGHQH